MKKLLAKILGLLFKKNLKLKEGPLVDKKKWYESKTVWTSVCIVVFGLYDLVASNLAPAAGISLPAIPEWIFSLLGALGIYTRVTATKMIK